MRRTCGVLVAGLSIGVVACGDDGSSSPEQMLRVDGVAGPIVELDGAVWVLAGEMVVEFDTTTREVVREIDMGTEYSGALASDGEVLWVTGVYGLKRIDPATGAVITTDLGYHSLATAAGRLFASRDGNLYELDPATGDELSEVTLPPNQNGFNNEVVQMPLVAVGDRLWVTVAEDDFSFTAFDPAAGTFGAKVEVDEAFGSAVLVADVIWLADRYGNFTVADAITGEPLDTTAELPVGETILDSTGSLFVGPDGTLWLLDQPAQNVYQLDPRTGATLASFHLTERPSAMVVTANDLWITNGFDDKITVLPRSAMKPVVPA